MAPNQLLDVPKDDFLGGEDGIWLLVGDHPGLLYRVVQNGSKWSKVLQNGSYFVQNGPKWFNTV